MFKQVAKEENDVDNNISSPLHWEKVAICARY